MLANFSSKIFSFIFLGFSTNPEFGCSALKPSNPPWAVDPPIAAATATSAAVPLAGNSHDDGVQYDHMHIVSDGGSRREDSANIGNRDNNNGHVVRQETGQPKTGESRTTENRTATTPSAVAVPVAPGNWDICGDFPIRNVPGGNDQEPAALADLTV